MERRAGATAGLPSSAGWSEARNQEEGKRSLCVGSDTERGYIRDPTVLR